MNQRLHKKQFIEPYLMSSHPGSGLAEAIELAEYLQATHGSPEQVQDFYPTPSTISTCMYYTGLDPRTMEPVYVARNPHEKAMQRALIQYRDPKNYALVTEALRRAGREDLIGFGPQCLVRPRAQRKNRSEAEPGDRHMQHPASDKHAEKRKTRTAWQKTTVQSGKNSNKIRPAYQKSLKRSKNNVQ